MPLYVISSPIGNLSDLSPRAVETLANADVVAAEDTRRTGQLLQTLSLKKRLVSFYEEVEQKRLPSLVEALARGESVALITDAGTPAVSDPGFTLVRAAIEAGVPVVPIPGPSAVLAALVASGLATDRFRFEGFVPRSDGQRRRAVDGLRGCEVTTVYFESPARLQGTLDLLAELLPDRSVVVGRELTKLHEEVVRGSASEVAAAFRARERIRGEITLLVGGGQTDSPVAEISRYVEEMRREGLAPSVIRTLVSRLLGVHKSDVKRAMEDPREEPE